MSRDRRTNPHTILDALAQDARVMRSARMLPTGRPLTPQEIAQVGRDLRKFSSETRRSMASIARALDVSAGNLSTFVNHKSQTGDGEELARRINAYIEQESRRSEQVMPSGFVLTNVAERIITAMRTTVNASAMGIAYGQAGVGKSMVASAAEGVFPAAVTTRVMQSTRRGPGLVNHLAERLGVPRRNDFAGKQAAIIEHLAGTNRLLVFDEAHQLSSSGIETLRDIHDAAGVPMFFLGTIDLRKRMDDADMFFSQLSSRIAVRLEIDAAMLRTRNPRPLFTTDEILRLFEGQKLKLTADGAAFLTDLSNTPGAGGLRIVKQVVGVAARASRSEPITAQMCRRVIAQLHDIAWIEKVETRGERSGLKVAVA